LAKRALLIGIDEYSDPSINNLSGCVADAMAMAAVLSRNDDGGPNFDCQTLTSPGSPSITRALLRQKWRELFHEFRDDVLFYFSGHGAPSDLGGFLVTQDGSPDDPGLAMQEVVDLANNSAARSVLLILDCCFSGSAGNPTSLQSNIENRAVLREGVTILAASRPAEIAVEIGGHGVFTDLVLGALRGGAADVRGRVSAASIYAYSEAALGGWDSRPLYKSHAAQLDAVRLCDPKVPDAILRELPRYFAQPDDLFKLDPSFEETNDAAKPDNVEVFKKMKLFQIGGLVRPTVGRDLYWTAERSESVVLTDLGKFYRTLAVRKRI
jgi:hypothetical protein